jgi:chromosome segregation ATPase
MRHVHLKRIKKSESGNPIEDEWIEIPNLGERLPEQIIPDVLHRTIMLEEDKKGSLERVTKNSPQIKDQIQNLSQYIKLVNTHVKEKKSELKDFQERTKRFDQEIASLKPQSIGFKFDLTKLNYKEDKVKKLQDELETLQKARQEIKTKIQHFTNQLANAQQELNLKSEQIEDIALELKRLEKKEILKNKIDSEEQALDVIKRELSFIGNIDESRKIFGAVNALVDLLKSKNQTTLNELQLVKEELKELKIKYEELISKLR